MTEEDRRQRLVRAPESESEIRAADENRINKATEEEKKTRGQREINLIWEQTQMKVALSVVWASLAVSITLGLFGKWLGNSDVQLAAIVFLFGVANLVTGFYFGRTNHTRTGGVGNNSTDSR